MAQQADVGSTAKMPRRRGEKTSDQPEIIRPSMKEFSNRRAGVKFFSGFFHDFFSRVK
jgi:hypothetical protein